MTLRELRIRAEANICLAWDQSAALAAGLHNLAALVHNGLGGTPRMRPATLSELHPLRRPQGRQRLRIDRENFHVLRQIFVR